MKAISIIARIVGVVATWAVTIALLGLLVQAPQWFWYHYSGTMPVDTYRWLDGCISIGSFLGSIVLLGSAAGLSVLLGVRVFHSAPPPPDVTPEM